MKIALKGALPGTIFESPGRVQVPFYFFHFGSFQRDSFDSLGTLMLLGPFGTPFKGSCFNSMWQSQPLVPRAPRNIAQHKFRRPRTKSLWKHLADQTNRSDKLYHAPVQSVTGPVRSSSKVGGCGGVAIPSPVQSKGTSWAKMGSTCAR